MERILVTGATGNIGAALLRELAGQPGVEAVAALRDPARAPRGVTAVRFDFSEPETFAPALRGCARVFLLRPPAVTASFGPLIEQMRRAGVRQVVFVSVQGAERNPFLPHSRTERLLRASGLASTLLRPAYFMQNFLGPLRADLEERHCIFLPAGRARFTLVDTRDVAGVASLVLVAPVDRYAGRAYALTAAHSMSFARMAAELSRGLGRPIGFISPGPWRFYRTKRREGMPRPFALVMLLLHWLPRFQAEPPVTGDLAALLGRPPREFAQFVADYRARLTPAAAPPPARSR